MTARPHILVAGSIRHALMTAEIVMGWTRQAAAPLCWLNEAGEPVQAMPASVARRLLQLHPDQTVYLGFEWWVGLDANAVQTLRARGHSVQEIGPK